MCTLALLCDLSLSKHKNSGWFHQIDLDWGSSKPKFKCCWTSHNIHTDQHRFKWTPHAFWTEACWNLCWLGFHCHRMFWGPLAQSRQLLKGLGKESRVLLSIIFHNNALCKGSILLMTRTGSCPHDVPFISFSTVSDFPLVKAVHWVRLLSDLTQQSSYYVVLCNPLLCTGITVPSVIEHELWGNFCKAFWEGRGQRKMHSY